MGNTLQVRFDRRLLQHVAQALGGGDRLSIEPPLDRPVAWGTTCLGTQDGSRLPRGDFCENDVRTLVSECRFEHPLRLVVDVFE